MCGSRLSLVWWVCQSSPYCFASESSHLIHFAFVVLRYRRHPICSASCVLQAAECHRTVRLTASVVGLVARFVAHSAFVFAICMDHGVECRWMTSFAAWSVLVCHSGHVSFGRRLGAIISLTIHLCNTSRLSLCCLVVVQLSAPHRSVVVTVVWNSCSRRLSVACFEVSASFCAQKALRAFLCVCVCVCV